jgi:hypothetical protein
MRIRLKNELAFVTVCLLFKGQSLTLEQVVLDTGSAGTLISVEKLLSFGLQLEPSDMIHRIRGVGGSEFVFTKSVDRISVGELFLHNFEIEVGALDYGFQLDGVLGLDFLHQVKAHIDLERLILY